MNNNFLKKINLLRQFDTPTICNGLELIDQNYKIKNYSFIGVNSPVSIFSEPLPYFSVRFLANSAS